MIPSLPRPAWLRAGTTLTVVAFLLFLFLPLIIVAVFAFNNAPYPAPPWRGFTLDWFLGNEALGRTGMFQDTELLASIGTSCLVAVWVTVLCVSDRTLPLSRQAGFVLPDARAARDPRRHSRHLDPRLRKPARGSCG
jgi:hypothetical protein